jgi:hypothetical protein
VELNAVNAKMNTTIYLNPELINLAKDMGLNISKTCENALKSAISRLQGLNPETTDAIPQFGRKIGVVDRAGFEPAAPALRTRLWLRLKLLQNVVFLQDQSSALAAFVCYYLVSLIVAFLG